MVDVNTALQRAVELLAEPPSNPDVSKGYLDLLGSISGHRADPPKNTGAIQAAWASPIGSMLYDNAQVMARRLMTACQHPTEWLDIPPGGVALDVGSGPGNVTASLARAAGPDGLALGVDISEPMLARAVRAEAGPQVGFLRADAQRLPFRDETFDAVAVDRDAAVDTETVGGAGRDGQGAAPRRANGRDGADGRDLPARCCGCCPTAEPTSSPKTKSPTPLRISASSECGRRAVGTIQWVRGKRP